MEQKHIEFLLIFAALLPIGTLFAKRYSRFRDFLVVLAIWMTIKLDSFDINLIGRRFYRAATRGIEISFVDLVAIILLLTVPKSGRSERPATYWLIWAYIAYAGLSIPLSEPMLFGTFELVKLLRGLLIFAAIARYVRGVRELRVLMIGVVLTVFYQAYFALEQRYVQGIHRIPGTLDHPNNLATFANFCAPILLTAALADYPKKYTRAFVAGFALCAVCVILTISRTGFAVIGLTTLLVVATCVKVEFTPKKAAMALVAVILVAGALFKAQDSLASRYGSATLEEEAKSDRGRGLYFRLGAAVFAERPFGVGLNNWSWVVTNDFYPVLGLPNKPYENTDVDWSKYSENEAENMVAPPAHNLWILTLGEVGIIGFGLFVAIWYRWMSMSFRFVGRRPSDAVSRYGAGVFFGMLSLTLTTMTEYSYRFPQIFFLVHLLVGAFIGLDIGRRHARHEQQAAARRTERARLQTPSAAPPGVEVGAAQRVR
jgi:hypothetical protein